MNKDQRFDEEIKTLIPHREPMLLINKIGHVDARSSSAYVYIDEQASFYDENKSGIPACIGLEYMGQTAALIGGYNEREGLIKPHLGFLLGTRKYTTELDNFPVGTNLKVSCEEENKVGDSLATFACSIHSEQSGELLATASLSVLRKEK